MGRITIRNGSVDDLQEVIAIERAAFPHPWSLDAFRRELSLPFSRLLIAEIDDNGANKKVAGFLCRWIIVDECHVLNVAVHPALRRRGIGRKLMTYVVEESRQAGVRLMTLEVRRSNFAARQLYREMGFEERRLRKNYYTIGEDAIEMERTLD
jgi:ribosomal-protein-alanine N-acetyltransferase